MMELARQTASFDSAELTDILFERQAILSMVATQILTRFSKKNVERRKEAFKRIETALGTIDTWKLPRCYGNLNREEQLLEGLKAGSICGEDGLNYNHTIFHTMTNKWQLGNADTCGLHQFLFIPILKQQASTEQLKHWLPLAKGWKILGAFAQTELGHGSFIRGLETTATFDEETDEFVLHSPTATSTKYWPGGFGLTSSRAIVMASLLIKGKNHGVHGFMVQLRSMKDYSPTRGIEMGDIG